MALPAWVSAMMDAPVAAIRRHVISLVVAVVCVIGAIYYAASAATLALEAAIGPVTARLVIAAILLITTIAAFYAPRFLHSPAAAEPAEPEMEGMTRDQKIAMVFEALLLGFSMGSRKPAANTDGRK